MTITNKEAIAAIKAYKNAKAKIAELETVLDNSKAIILNAMGDAESVTANVSGMKVTITNKAITTTRIDTKAVKAKYPAIATECSETKTAPRFIVK